MNNRIIALRKSLGLTQQEFADKLSIKRGTIANYEIGRNTPIDAVISLMCKTFSVNEMWLREGAGEMFNVHKENDSTVTSINERVKILRQTLGISQMEFGELLGLSKSGVADIESGRRNFTKKHKLMLLKMSDVPVNENWLMTGVGEMFHPINENEIDQSSDVDKLIQLIPKLSKCNLRIITKLAEIMVVEKEN